MLLRHRIIELALAISLIVILIKRGLSILQVMRACSRQFTICYECFAFDIVGTFTNILLSIFFRQKRRVLYLDADVVEVWNLLM